MYRWKCEQAYSSNRLTVSVGFKYPVGLLFSRLIESINVFIQKTYRINRLIMSPTMRGLGGGVHIVFSADPVGVGVANCLHSISLLNGQILAKLTHIYHWEGENCWLDFGDLDPIFKVTGGLRSLKKWDVASCLHSISLLNGQILAKLTQM